MKLCSRPWRIAPVTTEVRMEHRWGMEACWCGRVCLPHKASNEPQDEKDEDKKDEDEDKGDEEDNTLRTRMRTRMRTRRTRQ